MCSPTALAVTAIVMTAAAGGMQVHSQRQQGKQQKALSKYNAKLSMRQAEDAIDRGRREEAAHRRKVSAFKGRQAAIMGGSGADIGSGSSIDILSDTAMLGELDALTIRNNAERESYGYRSQALSGLWSGKVAGYNARNQAFGTIIGTAGKVAGIGSTIRPSGNSWVDPDMSSSRSIGAKPGYGLSGTR